MTNINKEYIENYIRDILPKKEDYLLDMEEYAIKNHIPIIQPEVAQFLKLQLKLLKPKRILEIGTAIGYSSLIMAESITDAKITTIEIDEDMIYLAKDYISKTPYEESINIIWGDALDVLPFLENKFDFIFIDAAKGQYMEFLEYAMNLLNPGGLIISDNVLYKGMVASDKLVDKRKITIVKNLRKYLKYINEIKGYTSSVIPIGDGVALTYKEEIF